MSDRRIDYLRETRGSAEGIAVDAERCKSPDKRLVAVLALLTRAVCVLAETLIGEEASDD